MSIGRRIWVLLLLIAGLAASCEARQLAVIVDKTNNTGGLSTTDLAKVFKFDSHKWPDGRPVILVLRDPSTPEMKTAIEKLYHMQVDEFKSLLAAHASGVIIVRSEDELLKSVEAIPGAVGLVDGKLPLEQGYFLKGN
jgi:hypothetical protein